jgi:hypothetical protein
VQNFVNELDPEFVQAEGDEKEKEFYVSFYNLPYVAHHQKLPSLNSLTFLPGHLLQVRREDSGSEVNEDWAVGVDYRHCDEDLGSEARAHVRHVHMRGMRDHLRQHRAAIQIYGAPLLQKPPL